MGVIREEWEKLEALLPDEVRSGLVEQMLTEVTLIERYAEKCQLDEVLMAMLNMGFESQKIAWDANRLVRKGIIDKERREKIGNAVNAIEGRTIRFIEDALINNCRCQF